MAGGGRAGIRLRSAARRAARRVARSPLVRGLILEGVTTADLPTIEAFEREGEPLVRYAGYRDVVVPRWRGALQPRPPEPAVGAAEIADARREVAQLARWLEVHGTGIHGARILEVGCHGGAHAYALAEAGAAHVEAIDIPDYGAAVEVAGKPDPAALAAQSSWLDRLRRRTHAGFEGSVPADAVTFADLDVHDLADRDGYDLIVSWETLEHLLRPADAIATMAAALRPGGVAAHVYNPFFSKNGGHSPATLDGPWHHTRLTDADLDRYVARFRPAEAAATSAFLHGALNRLTLADLDDAVAAAGLEMVETLPWPRADDEAWLSAAVVADTRAVHPSARVIDLLSRDVWTMWRRAA